MRDEGNQTLVAVEKQVRQMEEQAQSMVPERAGMVKMDDSAKEMGRESGRRMQRLTQGVYSQTAVRLAGPSSA